MIPAVPIWASLTTLPLEWAALALLTVGAIYWERSALSGIGIEGCVLSAMLGLCLGYEWSGSYAIAALAGVGASLAFALVTSVLLLWLRSDPVMGSFCLSLIPGAALILFSRQTPLRLLHDTPPPGLFRGTIFDGTYSEDLILNPWFLAAPLVLALAALVMLKTPYGLQLRGYSENPAFARHGPWPVALALGPALLRTLRPYAAEDLAAGIALQAAPFLLALLYLIFLSRRALRAATTSQTRLDPDVL